MSHVYDLHTSPGPCIEPCFNPGSCSLSPPSGRGSPRHAKHAARVHKGSSDLQNTSRRSRFDERGCEVTRDLTFKLDVLAQTQCYHDKLCGGGNQISAHHRTAALQHNRPVHFEPRSRSSPRVIRLLIAGTAAKPPRDHAIPGPVLCLAPSAALIFETGCLSTETKLKFRIHIRSSESSVTERHHLSVCGWAPTTGYPTPNPHCRLLPFSLQ